MPMKSQAQRRYLWSQHPNVAREFEEETPKGAKLPSRLHPKGKGKRVGGGSRKRYKAVVDKEWES